MRAALTRANQTLSEAGADTYEHARWLEEKFSAYEREIADLRRRAEVAERALELNGVQPES